jgi:hypothetical protein
MYLTGLMSVQKMCTGAVVWQPWCVRSLVRYSAGGVCEGTKLVVFVGRSSGQMPRLRCGWLSAHWSL